MQLLREFDNYHLDIVCTSEVISTVSGRKCHDLKTILYSGNDDQHMHHIGIVLNKVVEKVLVRWNPVSEHIIIARFQSQHGKTNVMR